MKTKIILILFILSAFACKKNKHESKYGKIISHSECKNHKGSSADNDKSIVQYAYNQKDKTLSIEHINTAFNCCPNELYCDISVENKVITIKESEKEAACNCMCLFDIKAEVYDIEAGKYTIKIIEPYIGSQPTISFEINLSEKTSGSYSVERGKYPWGL